LATRFISAKAFERSGMKCSTSAEATTSNPPSPNGSAIESATRRSACGSLARANAICCGEGSMPLSDFGAQCCAINWLDAPVPQPMSSQRAFAGGASQARNFSPIARLHRPM
jgi:hypothetical protein